MLSTLYWRQIMPGDKAIFTHKVLKMESEKLQRGHWWDSGSFKQTLILMWGKTSAKLHLRYLRIILLSYLYYCLNVFFLFLGSVLLQRYVPSSMTSPDWLFGDGGHVNFSWSVIPWALLGDASPPSLPPPKGKNLKLLVRYSQWNSESLSFTFFEYLLPLYWSTLLKICVASLSEGKILKRGSRLG